VGQGLVLVNIAWPSTTQIIKYFGLMGDYDAFGNSGAMRRGRLVTAACHLIAESQPLGEGWEARHSECHPYIDAFRKFVREHELELLEAERQYRSEPYRFTSRPDQIVMLDHSGPIDLELKSGSMPRWCPLQTAGQVLAMGQPHMKRYALLLKHDGDYQLTRHEDFRDLDHFRAMIEVWWLVHDLQIGESDERT